MLYAKELARIQQSHNKLTAVDQQVTVQGSGRTPTPVFCDVKLLFLSMESGGYEESIDNGFSSPLESDV